ncbi:hypothetical protein BDV36DRAFT_253398 [Aspergillus pseudocaelatus]|uniref:Myb-like DNA-binding domain protein n=1 Tax=Aspergillus pseudocaelatus TaxID=1825620 RepID=A0ABQ6WQ06_9EURO|nr:hypothetical protein BDV36DRAFT_253398 [Aspergillus pseudocaelatus]
MGNGSSKKAEDGIRDHTQIDGSDVTPSRPKTLKVKEKETPKGQSDDAATPKRKRKSSKHSTSAVAPSSFPAEEESRPSKRKKLADAPTDTTEDDRNTEKASTTANDTSPVKAQVNGSPSIEGSNDASIQRETVKKGKRKQSGKGLTGFFSQDEVQALESFKVEFCNSHGLPGHAFDAMVQHSEREKGIEFPCDSSITMKPEFWKTIYKILPDRDRRSVYRFMRRHFQNSDVKPHHWTHEQDEELIQLVARYGFKFAQIAKELGRSDDDVVQRWKNRLEHRTTMNRGPWSEQEIRGLQNALQAVWKNLKERGHDVGRDIYEMDETLISWGHISNKIRNCRSRQQCADKWRKARKKVQQLRDKGNPDAVFDPIKESKKNRHKSRTSSPSSSQTPQPLHKSAEYVHSDDSDEGEAAHQDEKKGKSDKTSTKDSSSSDKSSSPASESESTDESSSGNTTKDVKSKAKRNERPKVKDQLQATESMENTKTTPQKRKKSASSSSASDSEDSDSSTGSDVPAHPQTLTNGKSKTSPVGPKNKDKNEKSSTEDDSSDSSDDGNSESDGESDESESDVTSSSGNEKGKLPKKASKNIKPQPEESSAEKSTSSEDENESDDSKSSESESVSPPAPKSSKSKQKSTKEAGALKRRRVADLSSTSTSARSSASRDIKMEVTSD